MPQKIEIFLVICFRMEGFYNIPIEFGFTVKLVTLIIACLIETYSTVSLVNIFPVQSIFINDLN
jgi:predicted membrane protein